MSEPDLTRKDVEKIIELIKSASDVTEFKLKYGKTEIHISRGQPYTSPAVDGGPPPRSDGAAVPSHGADEPATVLPPEPSTAFEAQVAESAANEIVVTAPMVGTFYRASAPGEAPFVEMGQEVEANTVLCIIEVMKLMNSVSAGNVGTVTKILIGDGDPVEFGQPLMILRVSE